MLVKVQAMQAKKEVSSEGIRAELEEALLTQDDRDRHEGRKVDIETTELLESQCKGPITGENGFPLKGFFTKEMEKSQTDSLPSVYITRPLSAEERKGAAAGAMEKEASKVEKKGAFGDPVLASSVTEGTWSGIAMLGYVKNAESPSLSEYKGRLVVLGDRIWDVWTGRMQEVTGAAYGMVGEVANLAAFRSCCIQAAVKGYVLRSCDVKTAYLNAEWADRIPTHYVKFDEKTLASMSPEFRQKVQVLGGARNVLVPLRRALYGHPLAGFMWQEVFEQHLESAGWRRVEGLPALFKRGECMLVSYVDDVCIAGPDGEVNEAFRELEQKYDLSSLGPTERFIGIRVTQKKHKIELDLEEYLEDMVNKAEEYWGNCVKVDTPLANENESPLEGERDANGAEVCQRHVAWFVGKLLWAARTTRPDVSFAASGLASRASRQDENFKSDMLRMIGYLKKHRGKRLELGTGSGHEPHALVVQLYSDASWRSPRSQSGGCIVIESVREGEENELVGTVDWLSKRQSVCADSSGASELIAAHTCMRTFRAMAHPVQVCLGLRHEPPTVWIDNSSVIRVAKTGGRKSDLSWLSVKPLGLRVGVLYDAICLGIIQVGWCPTDVQRADLFTKAFARVKLGAVETLVGLKEGRMSDDEQSLPVVYQSRIVSYHQDKKYGYIMNVSGGRADMWFHESEWKCSTRSPLEGDRVEYNIGRNKRGDMARSVRPISLTLKREEESYRSS